MRPRDVSVRTTPSTLTPRTALTRARRDRLAVGDDGERLERGLGQLGLLAVEHELLHDGRVVGPAVDAPAARDAAQGEPALRGGILLLEGVQVVPHVLDGQLERRRERDLGDGLVDDHEHRLEGRAGAAREVVDVEGDLLLAARLGLASRHGRGHSSALRLAASRRSAGRRRQWSSRRRRTRRTRRSTSISPVVGAGPADVELAERLGLLEGDRGLPEELEQGEEAGDDDERAVGVGDEAPERDLAAVGAAASTRIAACSRTLTWGACRCSSPTVGRDLGRHRARRDHGRTARASRR